MSDRQRTAVQQGATRERDRLGAVDPQLSTLRRATAGEPVLVSSPEGQPAFWLVPFLVEGAACGFARVELSLKVSQLGIFGGHPEDRESWVDAEFFQRPAARTLEELRARYPGAVLSTPLLSYDRSPARWAWRVELDGGRTATIFISPGGWYEGRPG